MDRLMRNLTKELRKNLIKYYVIELSYINLFFIDWDVLVVREF
jgi:hypothetical protein